MRCRSPPSPLLARCSLAGCGEDDAGATAAAPVVATTTQVADLARNVGGDRVPVDRAPHAQRRPARLRAAPARRQGARRRRSSCCARAARSTSGSRRREAARHGRAAWSTLGRRTPRRAARTRTGGRTRATAIARRRGDPRRAGRGRPGGARGLRAPTRAALRRAGCARSTAAVARCIAAIPRGPAQARHHPRRARLLRAPLRPRGHRHVIPSLLDRGAGVGGRDRRAGRRRSGASGVPAVFAESSVNPKVEQAIAREAGARVGRRCGPTRSGRRAPAARPTCGSIEANTRAIVDGLGGGAVLAAAPEPARAVRRALHAARAGRDAAARRARRACSAPGSCCGGSRSSPTRSAPPRSRGSSSPARGGSRRSSRRSAAALGFAGARRAARAAAPAARTPPPGSCSSARSRSASCWPPTSTSPGAGVDRLLFGTLIGLSDRDLWLTAAVAAAPCWARRRRCAARGWPRGFDPGARRARSASRRGRRPAAARRRGGRRGRRARRRRRAARDRRARRSRPPPCGCVARDLRHAAARRGGAGRGRGRRRAVARRRASTSAPGPALAVLGGAVFARRGARHARRAVAA